MPRNPGLKDGIPLGFTNSQRRRREIFVVREFEMDSSSLGAAWVEICRSYGACDFVGWRFYKDVTPTALWGTCLTGGKTI